MSQTRIAQLKNMFGLVPHPEGGYYAEKYRSSSDVASPVDGASRASLSHIYFLLTEGQLSRWHKVLHDEIWNVYEGSPLRILTLNDQGIHENIIGTELHKSDEQSSIERDFFEVIKGGNYQAAESTGEYTLVGCSVAPGFEFRDFSYIEDEATKKKVEALGKDYMKFL